MNIITKYKAVDGKEFVTELECRNHESHIEQASEVNKILPSAVDDNCSFVNGDGFIQQSPEDIAQFKKSLADLIGQKMGEEVKLKFLFNSRGIAGRIIDDSGETYIYKLMTRLHCIDEQNREWGQVFYAIHPERASKCEPWPNVSRKGL